VVVYLLLHLFNNRCKQGRMCITETLSSERRIRLVERSCRLERTAQTVLYLPPNTVHRRHHATRRIRCRVRIFCHWLLPGRKWRVAGRARGRSVNGTLLTFLHAPNRLACKVWIYSNMQPLTAPFSQDGAASYSYYVRIRLNRHAVAANAS
jgi:hypothetical protein